MRYTDEGETVELCKWTVDLASLPTFRQHAQTTQGGFYTGENWPGGHGRWELLTVMCRVRART